MNIVRVLPSAYASELYRGVSHASLHICFSAHMQVAQEIRCLRHEKQSIPGYRTGCAYWLQVQAHGAETGFGGAPALFFLPHAPLVRSEADEDAAAPLFLLMKGRDWCCAGADHYEPLLAQKRILAPGKSLEPYIHLGD